MPRPLPIAEYADQAFGDVPSYFDEYIDVRPFHQLLSELSPEHRQAMALDWSAFAAALSAKHPTRESLRTKFQPVRFRLGVAQRLTIEDRLEAGRTSGRMDRLNNALRAVEATDDSDSDKLRMLFSAVGIDEQHEARAEMEEILRTGLVPAGAGLMARDGLSEADDGFAEADTDPSRPPGARVATTDDGPVCSQFGAAIASMETRLDTKLDAIQRQTRELDAIRAHTCEMHERIGVALEPTRAPRRPRGERRRERRRTALVGGALVALAATALLLLWPASATKTTGSERSARAEERLRPVDQTLHLDGLTVIVSHAVAFADRVQLFLYMANLDGRDRVGGVVLDDGEGHQVEVMPAGESVPAKSVQRRVSEVGDDFNDQSKNLHVTSEVMTDSEQP